MKVRLIASLPVLLAGLQPGIASPVGPAESRPWMIVNLDANHYQNLYSDDEMTVEAIERYADEYLGGAVTHVFVNPNGMRAYYPSKALETVWAALEEPGVHKTDMPWLKRTKLLHDRGIDLYETILDRVRKSGKAEGWISMRMNDHHDVNDERSPLVSIFWLRRPDLWCVPYGKTLPNDWSPRAFDYTKQEVRDHYLAAARELFDRYDMDGFDVDWKRSSCTISLEKGRQLVPCLTEVMRAIRKAADEATVRRGHRIRVSATVPTRIDVALAAGMDVLAWAKERLVDVILPANDFRNYDLALPYAQWLHDVHAVNPDVRIVPRVDTGVRPVVGGPRIYMIRAHFAAWHDNLLAQGCRDFGFFNLFSKRHQPKEIWDMYCGCGVTPESVRSQHRIYSTPYLDYVPEGLSNLAEFPFDMENVRSVKMYVGSIQGVKRVYLNAGFERAVGKAPDLRLNGVAATSAETGAKGRISRSALIAVEVRYSFPVSALKAGVNMVAYPVVAGGRANGCEIEVE